MTTAVQSTWLKIDSLYKTLLESKKRSDQLSEELMLLEVILGVPDLIIIRICSDGMVSFSNSRLLHDPLTNTSRHISEFVPEADLEILKGDFKEVLKTGSLKKALFSLGTETNSTIPQVAVIVPYNKEEAIILCSGHLRSGGVGMNIANLMEILAFLPGKTMIAKPDHHLIKIDKEDNTYAHKSVGESIDCPNFDNYGGACGQMHICNSCELRAAVTETRSGKIGVVRREVTLPVREHGKPKYKKHLVTTSCIRIGGEESYIIYLEDLIDDKLQLKHLKGTNELLSSVLNSLPISVYWKNLNSTYLGGNTKFANELNIKNEETLIGMYDTNLFDIETAQKNIRDDKLSLSIDKPTLRHEYAFSGLHAKKKLKMMKAPLIDAKGKKIGVIGADVDFISEKWFEVNEDESHLSLAKMADKVGAALWEWDLKNDVLSGNEAWLKTSGLDKKILGIHEFQSKIYGADQKIFLNIEEKLKVNKDYQFKLKVRVLQPEEEFRWIEMEGKKMYMDPLGNPVRVVGWGKDITSYVERELEYNRKNTFTSALLDSCNDFIWSVDKNFTFISLNQALKARLFLLYNKEFEVGKNFFATIEDVAREKWEKRYQKAFQGGRFSVVEEFDDNGIKKMSETSFNPIVIEGEIVGVSCFSRIRNKEISQ